MLSGKKIKKLVEENKLMIEPFDEKNINPNSYDVHLGDRITTYRRGVLDPRQKNPVSHEKIPKDGMILNPGELFLAATMEYTETPNHIPCIDGVSSNARLGIDIHATAGFGDIGFRGVWTLEISVVRPVRIYAGMRIGQLYYENIDGEYNSYDGRYQNSADEKASKSYEDKR